MISSINTGRRVFRAAVQLVLCLLLFSLCPLFVDASKGASNQADHDKEKSGLKAEYWSSLANGDCFDFERSPKLPEVIVSSIVVIFHVLGRVSTKVLRCIVRVLLWTLRQLRPSAFHRGMESSIDPLELWVKIEQWDALFVYEFVVVQVSMFALTFWSLLTFTLQVLLKAGLVGINAFFKPESKFARYPISAINMLNDNLGIPISRSVLIFSSALFSSSISVSLLVQLVPKFPSPSKTAFFARQVLRSILAVLIASCLAFSLNWSVDFSMSPALPSSSQIVLVLAVITGTVEAVLIAVFYRFEDQLLLSTETRKEILAGIDEATATWAECLPFSRRSPILITLLSLFLVVAFAATLLLIWKSRFVDSTEAPAQTTTTTSATTTTTV